MDLGEREGSEELERVGWGETAVGKYCMREEYINILENKVVKRFKGGQQMSKSQVRLRLRITTLICMYLLYSLLSVILGSRKGLMDGHL